MRLRFHFFALLLALTLLGISPAAEEKQLGIYSPQTSFTVPVVERDGHEYVSITDILDPFGRASFEISGKKWKLTFADSKGKKIQGEFEEGSNKAQIRKKSIHLVFPFRAENQRGYVPMSSVSIVLAQLTGGSAVLREDTRRLFLGEVSTSYTVELQKGIPPRLVLHFTAPVNPSIATEPGHLRMTFNRDPLLSSGNNQQKFDDPTIRSLNFTEGNGVAEITVNSGIPLLANFTEGRRTITLTPVPVQIAQKPVIPLPATPPPIPRQTTPAMPSAATATPPKMIVIIDPAHGGDDPGEALGGGLQEKNVTLAIARRIRNELDARGIIAVLTRDSDSTLTLDQRAIAANTSRAALYVSVHADTLGYGVRLYSAQMGSDPQTKHRFLPWNTAHASFLAQSHNLVASLVTELEYRQIQSVPLEAAVRPLRNIAKPAIAIEVAPSLKPSSALTSAPYQQSIASAVAEGIANLRSSLERPR